MSILKCPVCNMNLSRKDNSYQCENNHSYDISKRGYTNMLLANQHHSLNPGDSKEMIEARVRFLETNKYHCLRQKLTDIICLLSKGFESVNFLDIASGEGYYTNYIHKSLQKDCNVNTYGIDISKQGVIEGCKKIKAEHLENIEYFIGNIFNMPFINESFDIMLNCFAPMDEIEFSRVLKKEGYYIRVLPDYDHLYDLKAVLYENVKLNVMKEKKLNGFELVDEIHLANTIELTTNQQINDLFMMTPYYYKSPIESSKKLMSMDYLKTKISFVIFIYKKNA